MASPDSPIESPSASGYGTPRLSYNGIHFTPRRAVASFENLVALANYQERLKEARKMVWRDKGQPVVELQDIWECLEHAARGGLRAGTLAFNIRASVNVVLALIRIRKVPRDIRTAFIKRAIFGLDTLRFAAMLGTFVALYKFLLNVIPLRFPALNQSSPFRRPAVFSDDLEGGRPSKHSRDGPRTTFEVPLAERRARLSLTANAQLMLVRKKTRRWHAALAGAVAGGLAIMFEIRSRRTVIGQQMFVRGLQGSWNSFATKRKIRIPHGDVLVFSLACGQIMYGFLLRPDTLPRSYSTWIGQASKVPLECVRINHDLVRHGTLDLSDVDTILNRNDITPNNHRELVAVKELAMSTLGYHRRYVPCPAIHPWMDSCMAVPLDRFIAVFKWMLPIYGALHLIPMVLFKRSAFTENPWRMLLRAGWGTTRSSAFLGVFVVIYQTVFCFKHNLHAILTSRNSTLNLPRTVIDILISKPSFWFTGVLAGLSLFVEAKRRRGELAMYVLPKGLESAWVMARGKGLVFKTGKYGEVILTAIGTGMVMSTYQTDPQHLSGLVRRILYQFIGPN